jgi:hypothetical protein
VESKLAVASSFPVGHHSHCLTVRVCAESRTYKPKWQRKEKLLVNAPKSGQFYPHYRMQAQMHHLQASMPHSTPCRHGLRAPAPNGATSRADCGSWCPRYASLHPFLPPFLRSSLSLSLEDLCTCERVRVWNFGGFLKLLTTYIHKCCPIIDCQMKLWFYATILFNVKGPRVGALQNKGLGGGSKGKKIQNKGPRMIALR